MKMKVLLSVIVFTLYTVSYAQNMKMIDTSMPKKDKKDAVVIEYDSLTNIRPYKDASYYKQFIGQSILFYPRNPNSSESLPKYYANFLTSNEQVVAIDTIWRKKRSNPKPKDYKLNQITSKRYKPQLVKDNYVTLCASFHDILEQGYRIFPFEIYRATKCPMGKRDGIFTPYNEIEGKTFKILDIELSDAEVEENTIFALQSEEGDTLYWYAKRGEYDGFSYTRQHYPVIVLGFMDKMKQLYLNKDIYIKNIHPINKYKCMEIAYSGSEDTYMVPSFVLKNDSADLIMPLCESPSLFSYEVSIFDNQKRMTQMYFYNLDVVEAEVYEETMERERLAKEELLMKEKLAQEEAKKLASIKRQQRTKELYKKYGKATADLILKGQVCIEMTKAMVLESWGHPSGGINKTTGAWGIHEQWVYGMGQYLYFENGKLTTIQN